MQSASQLRVAVDVGSTRHRVAVGMDDGRLLDEFDIEHDGPGLAEFFARIARHEKQQSACAVTVAMEGYGGYARPLDTRVFMRGWRLYSVNNLKLARFKEIFPAPAKTDALDAKRMLELFQLQDRVPMARAVLQEVAAAGPVEQRLKAVTRRRKQLIDDRMRLSMRMRRTCRRRVQACSQLPGRQTICGFSISSPCVMTWSSSKACAAALCWPRRRSARAMQPGSSNGRRKPRLPTRSNTWGR